VNGGLPLDSHLATARGLELDHAFFQWLAARRDQLDKRRLGGLRPEAWRYTEPLLQPHVVQPQRVRNGIDAVLPGQFDRSLPQRFRQLRSYRLGASELLQLALQLRDWFGNGSALTVHDQPHLGG